MAAAPDQPEEEEGSVTVPVVWVGVDDLPVQFVNQFVGVVAPNEVFLTLGSIVPPALLGTEEQRKVQAESIQFVQVTPVARLALTPTRLEELIGVLNQTLANYKDLRKRTAQ